MKSIMFLILISGNLFAGDMYLTCEDKSGDRFYTDYVMDRAGNVEFVDVNMCGTKYNYNVSAAMGEINTYTISKTLMPNTYNHDPIVYTVITNSWSDEVRISENISCALRD